MTLDQCKQSIGKRVAVYDSAVGRATDEIERVNDDGTVELVDYSGNYFPCQLRLLKPKPKSVRVTKERLVEIVKELLRYDFKVLGGVAITVRNNPELNDYPTTSNSEFIKALVKALGLEGESK